MKKLVFLYSLFQLVAFHLSAGCEPRLAISKIYPSYKSIASIPGYSHRTFTIALNPTDSICVEATSNQGNMGSCRGKIEQIYYNDSLLPPTTTLICRPGVYKICGSNTACTFTIFNSLDIILHKPDIILFKEAASINLFPNPAHERITINSNSKEIIKSVSFYDLGLRLIKEIELNGSFLELPLNDFPQGVYFVFISTIDDKKFIRKLVIN